MFKYYQKQLDLVKFDVEIALNKVSSCFSKKNRLKNLLKCGRARVKRHFSRKSRTFAQYFFVVESGFIDYSQEDQIWNLSSKSNRSEMLEKLTSFSQKTKFNSRF